MDAFDPIKGRGARHNPPNRFEPLHYEVDPDVDPNERVAPRTRFFKDTSQSIISWNQSPDVPFEASINPYRGCEHGCIYCYARPTHEFLGLSAGLDFESQIMVKTDAPLLLRKELEKASWEPQTIAISGVTDAYQPAERSYRITRACLEVLAECRNPVAIITKNHLVTRDIDLLAELASHQAATVFVSVTSLDADLARKMEPRTSIPERRLDAIRTLTDAGIPTGFMMAPIIPGLTDHEIPAVVKACAEAGAQYGGYVLLRLPHAVKDLFSDWVRTHYPLQEEKIMQRIQAVRGGKLNDTRFSQRMRGEGFFAEQIASMFKIACLRHDLNQNEKVPLSTAAFRRPPGPQMMLDF
ncbi:MAG: DNA repair photolyase [Kiritimatiellia bacterium]|jgi:DNA repair photolyase